MQPQNKYLGFVIDENGVSPDSDKVKAIRTLPTPKCVKDVRSLLGAAGFYRRFCPQYSKIVEPLINLTRKRVTFNWNSQCQKSFEELKKMLTRIPLLAFPDPNKPYILYTDSSDTNIGACLSQKCDKNGTEKPVYYTFCHIS